MNEHALSISMLSISSICMCKSLRPSEITLAIKIHFPCCVCRVALRCILYNLLTTLFQEYWDEVDNQNALYTPRRPSPQPIASWQRVQFKYLLCSCSVSFAFNKWCCCLPSPIMPHNMLCVYLERHDHTIEIRFNFDCIYTHTRCSSIGSTHLETWIN